MKELIFKKLNLKILRFFLISILIFGIIVWTLQSIKYFDFVVEDGHGINIYFLYTLFNFPKIIHRILPFVFFISLFYTLIIYELIGELDIFWLNGINKILFLKKVLVVSIILMIFQIILGSFISPFSQLKSRNLLKNSNIDFFSSLIEEGKFINITQGLTIFVENKNNDGSFNNIFIEDDNNEEVSKMIYAAKGFLIDNNKVKMLRLYNGQVINRGISRINIFDFDKIDFNLQNLNSKSIIEPKIQEIDSMILLGCIFNFLDNSKIFNCDESIIKDIKQELVKRFIKPIYIPLIALMCIYLILFSKKKSNYKRNTYSIFIITFFILLLSETSLRYLSVSNYYLSIYLAIPLVIFLVGYYVLKYKIAND